MTELSAPQLASAAPAPAKQLVVGSAAACAQRGLIDAISMHNVLVFLLTSSTVRSQFMRCAALNLLIFSGSILLTNYVVMPAVRGILQPTHAGDLVALLFERIYHVFWIYPVYCVSFLLNTMWYQNVADSAFIVRGGKLNRRPATLRRWMAAMADELYRMMLLGAFLLQLTATSLVPLVGVYLWATQLAWLYAFYSFEYKWALQGWDLDTRIAYFERRWPYFLGFGAPSALLTVMFPSFISYGMFAFIFPSFIILAIVSRPVIHNDSPDYKGLRLFGYARTLNLMLLRRLQKAAPPNKPHTE